MKKNDIVKLLDGHKRASMVNFKLRFCGKWLGSGVSRNVYEFKPDPRYVVKIDYLGEWDNVTEYMTYQSNWHSPIQKYFAPCLWINSNGRILIQRRVTFRKRPYPSHLPNMLGDLKMKNYGWLNGRFVSCDYSRVNMWRTGQLRRVKWWNP